MPSKNSLFQQGGWATQLSCDNPALVSWLKYIEGARQAACSLMGVQCTTHENHCEQWTPLAIILTAVAVLLLAVYLLAVLLTSVVDYLRMWHKQSRSSATETVREATEAAATMRKQDPERFPPTPHSWYQIKADEEELGAPLLCAACFTRIDPEGSRVQCCEVCGVVAHDGTCVRKAAHDCKPVTEACDSMVHLWQPAGTIYYDSEDVFQEEEAIQVCIYCHHPCDADVSGFHPAWTCAWCRVHAHVSCYHAYHSNEPASTQHDGSHDGFQGHGDASARPAAVSKSSVRPSLDGIPEGREGRSGLLMRASASLDALLSLVKGPPDSSPSNKAPWAPPVRRPSHVDVARLDACSCGPHGRLVLPPVAVELVPNEDSWSELAKQFLRRESFRGKHSRRKAKGGQPDSAEGDAQHRRSAEARRAQSWDTDELQGASPMSSQEVAWEDASREGSQRLGGEGKREALLARWLQEGNKRLRQRLAPGSLTRQSDPGPPTSGTSIPAHTKGKELDPKQLNGAHDVNGIPAESSAPQASGVMHDGQQMPDHEQVSSPAAVVLLTEKALAERNPFEKAAGATGVARTATAKDADAKEAPEPVQTSADAADSGRRHEMQQKAEEKPGAKMVPRLKIPLSPGPASARELPSSRAAQPDSSAKNRGHNSEQLPDDGWSPRQATARSPRTDARGFMAAVSGYVSSSEGAGGTKMRRPGWWRGPAVTSWAQYRIQREKLPSGCSPLLVFLNTKSGAQTGAAMRRRFLRLLNPLQVVELPKEEPEAALRLFADIPGLRVLVVGGDGTIGWILSVLDQLQQQFAAQEEPWHWALPPVAVLPLGTGNDLARCLNWGGGLYVLRDRGLPAMLHDVEHATVSLLDRWDVRIARAPQPELSSAAQQIQRMSSLVARDKAENEQVQTKVMNNYMGIGVDAKVSLEFDRLRTKFPHWFKSQMGNKVWYTTMGAKDIIGHAISASAGSLPSKIKVEVDGKPLALPADIEGVLLLNIPSYAGGVNLWASGAAAGSAVAEDAVQSVCDGMLEVCGVHGSWHLGQLQIGLSRPIKLAQCRSARITLLEAIPVQMDGEPWRQPPATLEVSLHGQAFMLRRIESGPVAKVARAVAEVLASCEAKGVITSLQRHSLTAEIAGKLQNVV